MRSVSISTLVWENPPEAQSGGKYRAIAGDLRERPGEWARVGIFPNYKKAGQFATAIRNGRLVDFRPRGHFEVRVVTMEGGTRVYLRYLDRSTPSEDR